MSRGSILIVFGALMILAPFSGLPVALRTLIAIGLGAAVLGIGVNERSKEQRWLVAVQAPVQREDASPVPPVSAPELPSAPEATPPMPEKRARPRTVPRGPSPI